MDKSNPLSTLYHACPICGSGIDNVGMYGQKFKCGAIQAFGFVGYLTHKMGELCNISCK